MEHTGSPLCHLRVSPLTVKRESCISLMTSSQPLRDRRLKGGGEGEPNGVKRYQRQHEQNLLEVTAYLNHPYKMQSDETQGKLSFPVGLLAKKSLHFNL